MINSLDPEGSVNPRRFIAGDSGAPSSPAQVCRQLGLPGSAWVRCPVWCPPQDFERGPTGLLQQPASSVSAKEAVLMYNAMAVTRQSCSLLLARTPELLARIPKADLAQSLYQPQLGKTEPRQPRALVVGCFQVLLFLVLLFAMTSSDGAPERQPSGLSKGRFRLGVSEARPEEILNLTPFTQHIHCHPPAPMVGRRVMFTGNTVDTGVDQVGPPTGCSVVLFFFKFFVSQVNLTN